MITCTSISGGQSSAYIAVNYPTDYNVFALVTVTDKNCTPKDKKIVQLVSDRIGKDFIGTVEDDIILYTILDLEQKIGKKIDWVTGKPFEKEGHAVFSGNLELYPVSQLKSVKVSYEEDFILAETLLKRGL